jgi:hypothetical protein
MSSQDKTPRSSPSMPRTIFVAALSLVLGAGVALLVGSQEGKALQATNDELIAIDILLEPDQTMIGKANAANARLRGNFPAGYELDATHTPHITVLQRFVRARDLDAVTAAVNKGPRRRTAGRDGAESQGLRLRNLWRKRSDGHHRRAHPGTCLVPGLVVLEYLRGTNYGVIQELILCGSQNQITTDRGGVLVFENINFEFR